MTTPSIEGSLTFICLVEGTYPILFSIGLPSRTLYAEGAFTTRYLIFSVRDTALSVNVVLNSMYPLTSTWSPVKPYRPQMVWGQL